MRKIGIATGGHGFGVPLLAVAGVLGMFFMLWRLSR